MRRSPQVHSQPLLAESLSAMWLRLHSDERFAVRANEMHYFRALAVALDDDLSSLLLLKKLKLADEYLPLQLPSDVVALNSFVEFRIERGRSRFGQLLHPSPSRPDPGIDVDTRLGLGLLGLRSGQTILWPDEHETLRQLEVLRVDNLGRNGAAGNRSLH
jgi:regulator of nucleoside diphosphate kinase